MAEKTDSMDRISDLPPFIVHHIMSYLSPDEVAKTSVLSKRWRTLRESFPVLDFDQAYFVGTEREYDPETYEEIYDKRFCDRIVDFVKYVHVSTLRFCELNFRMQKFRICISLVGLKGSSKLLDGWIWLAVRGGVEDLDVDIQTDREKLYNLPQVLFSAKSVTTLKLGGCKLEQPSDSLRFCSLKSLTLDKVQLDEQMVQMLTSRCPLLEELFFYSCWGMKCFCISKALILKILHIQVYLEEVLESIKIVVPSLHHFRLVFEEPRISSCVIDMAGCPHLNDLELMGDIFKDQEFHDFISKFPLLENLSVEECHSLERIKISSNRLQKLLIANCSDLKAIEVDTPNLLFFTYLFNPIPLSSINASCPWRVVLDYEDVDALWYLKIKEFLRASNQNCNLTIYVESSWHAYDVDDFRKSLPAVFCEVEHLSLHMRRLPSNYAALLDAILWICYPKYLSIETGGEERNKFIKWVYDELRNEDVNCCKSHNIKCWRHYLKHFVVESSIITNDDEPMGIDNVLDELSTRPSETLRFCLDWSLPADDSITVEC